MTTTAEHLPDAEDDIRPARQRFGIGLAFALTVPGLVIRIAQPHWPHPLEAVIYGLAIVGAAFLLSWAAEVAQLDIGAGLAIAILALIAVLPEYAVDMVFAWKGGNAVEQFGASCQDPALVGVSESSCSLALANMTGANRLLIGIGWSLVGFIAYYRYRKRGLPGDRELGSRIVLERANSVEIGFLAIATVWSIFIPLRRTITLVDAAFLVSLFGLYTMRIARAPAEEPHLVGPARYLGTFAQRRRRTWVLGLFFFAATVIILCAEHFAEALVDTGKELGVSEFLLVQWLAPLASEAPELLVASLYAWRLNTTAGLGTLVSSKVNQWTLLVGTLPIVFAIASGSIDGLPIEARQREEIFLTAAQSVFAVAVLSSLAMTIKEALMLFGLFWTQFILGAVVPASAHGVERIGVGVVYLLLAMVILGRDRANIPRLFRDGFRSSYAELQREPEPDRQRRARARS